ncbi:MAG: response regulator transcription factor [Stenotrophomonas sp.]|uniref:response regulator transcription factor n=1 Tax=Stenotrophomonas sp. TaxID=69392 RepID=UPI003D6C9ECF
MAPIISGLQVLMVDDHVVVAHGVQRLLRGNVRSVDVVFSGEDLLAAMLLASPDVVVLDIGLPGISGIQALEAMRLFGFLVPVVMLTMYDDPALARKAIAAGAKGYVLKQASGDELLTAIEHAMRGEMFISQGVAVAMSYRHSAARFIPSGAQLSVLKLAERGLSAKQIAAELELSRRTVESHKYALMQHLGVNNTIQLISRAKAEGFI